MNLSTPSLLTAPIRLRADNWVESWQAPGGHHFALRPLRPADAWLLGQLFNQGLSSRSRFQRFHASLGPIPAERLAQMTQLNFECDAAYLVTRQTSAGEEPVAEGRLARQRGSEQAEFALSVADPWQQLGIGRRVMQVLASVARLQGAQQLCGEVWHDNGAMLGLMQQCRFDRCPHQADPQLTQVTLDLLSAPAGEPPGLWARTLDRFLDRMLGVRAGLSDDHLH